MRIAYAYELAAGNDPLDVSFDQGKIYKHLLQCSEKGRDSRTPLDSPLDSVRDKLMTLTSIVIVQCPSGTTWYSASLFQVPQQLIIVKIRK